MNSLQWSFVRPKCKASCIFSWYRGCTCNIITPTTVAHTDSEVWNNEQPIDQFWIGRFLKYPPAQPHEVPKPQENAPIFSTKDVEGSWIPYGGGPRQCLGRHFVKR
ncbi:hypothetical protein F5B22DRAFT_628301 [Xylaria bambusicola]|uniref:uncharacterized protein n=1 Tax=Xylaria bambusicola TaxID=326684 RepID=UPI0020076F39|nr:uncharacterized protein F5B22DRAFT_628301 [Xylaria bambusicola]KAI0505358.1 hypothetical protein F5B22DRAFT_628301 [Xylaria bambusicola]